MSTIKPQGVKLLVLPCIKWMEGLTYFCPVSFLLLLPLFSCISRSFKVHTCSNPPRTPRCYLARESRSFIFFSGQETIGIFVLASLLRRLWNKIFSSRPGVIFHRVTHHAPHFYVSFMNFFGFVFPLTFLCRRAISFEKRCLNLVFIAFRSSKDFKAKVVDWH